MPLIKHQDGLNMGPQESTMRQQDLEKKKMKLLLKKFKNAEHLQVFELVSMANAVIFKGEQTD